jgi:hypothetical protein
VVTFLRVGAFVDAKAGAGVDMVSSKMVGAVRCGHPLVAALIQLQDFCRRVHAGRIRAVFTTFMIIPQNQDFGYVEMSKSFVGGMFSNDFSNPDLRLSLPAET